MQVQKLVKDVLGKHALDAALGDMQLDKNKLSISKLRRHRVQSALAQLADMQKILRKGEKQTGKDIERVAHISQSVRRLVPMAESFEPWQIDSVPALKETAAMLQDVSAVCVAAAMRRRACTQRRQQDKQDEGEQEGEEHAARSTASTPTKIDALYRSLRSNIVPLSSSSSVVAHIQRMVEVPITPVQSPGSGQDAVTAPLMQLTIDKVDSERVKM